MAALFDGEKFLVERYNNVVFTRADKERMMRNVSPVWTGTGFGSTRQQTVLLLGDQLNFKALPGVDAELKEIFKTKYTKSGVLDGEVLFDEKFNQAALLAALKLKRPLVHIASHFSFRPGDEARSFLLLGDGTAFTLAELKKQTDIFTGVDLLTLSACNTAAQQPDANGKEIDGFAELAQRLGAGAVMATLWSVADNSTPWLMRGFYAERQNKSGITKAEALRQAQIALLNGTAKVKPLPYAEKGGAPNKLQIVIVPKGKQRDGNQVRDTTLYIEEEDAPRYNKTGKPPFAHPYYWSPFVLFGNWR
jgi:CHAT domain-containing protein